MPTVLVQGAIAANYADLMRKFAPAGWEVLVWNPDIDPVDDFRPMAEQADVIVGGAIPIPWPHLPKLKLFQIPWTGFDFTSPERMPAGLPVANTYEHESAIAEYVLLGMLEWQIGMREMDATFRAHGWKGAGPGKGPNHGEVRGQTLGIVGYGHIGHEVATRARAFGMRVIGIRRSAHPCPPELDWLAQTDQLENLLRQSDFVLIACDMNAETRGMIDAERLAFMKPTGVLINVARGKIIDEDALYDALRERRIGGAILDVWYNYNQPGKPDVWPSNRPFQNLENVILSGHRSALSSRMHERRWQFVASNLERVARGDEPRNIVFSGTMDTTHHS